MSTPSERIRKAIINGNLPITKRLLSRFPDLWLNTDPDNNGWSNLHYASYFGNYLICFHLVSVMGRNKEAHPDGRALCNLDMVAFDDLTVLHMPLFHQHFQTLHFLLQEFAGNHWIDYKGGPLKRTPLQYCCACNFADGFKLLLEYGADHTVQDQNGDTCMHLCFAYNDMACMQELVKHIVTQRLAAHMDPPDAPSAKALTAEARAKVKDAIVQDLEAFEAIRNSKNSAAIAYAATFDMEQKYLASRDSWIDAAIADELSMQSKAPWDSSFWSVSNSEQSSRKHAFPPASATSSMATYTNASASLRASVDSDLNALSSMATESSESVSRHTLTEERSTATEEASQAPVSSGRKHSRSLPHSADLSMLTEQAPARPHSSSLAGASRIASAQSRPAVIPQSVGYPTSPLSVEFTRTQSRKSGLPSPPIRSRSERFSTPEEQTDNPRHGLKIDVGLARRSSVSNTPTSAKSSHRFLFSPLRLVRSRSGSIPAPPPSAEEKGRPATADGTPKGRAPLSRSSSCLQRQSSSGNVRSSPTSTITGSLASLDSLGSLKRPAGRSADLLRMPGSSGSFSEATFEDLAETIEGSSLNDEISPVSPKQEYCPTPGRLSTPTFRALSSFKVNPIQETFEPESMRSSRNISSISFNRVREE